MRREERMQWDGNKVDAGAYVFLSQRANELIAIDRQLLQIQAQNVKVPRVTASCVFRGKLDFGYVGEGAMINLSVFSAELDETL